MIEFKQTMGVLGGMGPEATLSFYSRVIKRCQENLGSKYSEDFPHIIINSTQNPDGKIWKNFDESKLKKSLFDNCILLENAGVDFIVMPCNSVHFFIDFIRSATKVKVVSIVEETAKEIKTSGVHKVLLLSTGFTSKNKVYDLKLVEYNIDFIKPSDREQTEIEDIIIEVAGGNVTPSLKQRLVAIIEKYRVTDQISGVVLGCTEIPLVLQSGSLDIPIFDTLDILSKSAFHLITGERVN